MNHSSHEFRLGASVASMAQTRPESRAAVSGTRKTSSAVWSQMMNRPITIVVGFCAVVVCCGVARSAYDLRVTEQAFFAMHCFDCHDNATKEGGLDLSALNRD